MRNFLVAILFLVSIPVFAQLNTSLFDTSYNHTGYRGNSQHLFQNLRATDVDVQGRIISSYIQSNTGNEARFVRYTANGAIDTSFIRPGVLAEAFDTYLGMDVTYYNVTDIKAQADNKILVLASIQNFSGVNWAGKQVLTRLNEDGSIDSSFALNGTFVSVYDTFPNTAPLKILLQSDGKILIHGILLKPTQTSQYYQNSGNVFVRLNIDGSLDTTFNTVGYRIFPHFSGGWMVLNSNNQVVIAYEKYVNQAYNFNLLTLSESGDSLQTDLVNNMYASSPVLYFNDVNIDNNDNIYLGVYYYGNSNDSIALIKIKANHTLDTSFGTNGLAVYSNPGYSIVRNNVLCATGALYTASVAYKTHHVNGEYILESYLLLLKYTNTGQPDVNLGYNGKYYLSLPNSIGYNTEPVAYQLFNNKLLVRGGINILDSVGVTGSETFFAARLNIDTVSLILGLIDNPSTQTPITAYPNPIQNSTINLSYELQNKQNVSVALYGINGQFIVNLLCNQSRSTGKNTEALSLPANLSAGQYILQINVGENSSSIKIVVQ